MKLHVAVMMVLSGSALLAQRNAVLEKGAVPESTATATQYEPMTLSQRYKWAAWGPVSPKAFAGYVTSSAISTARNRPEEYGPHWEGYGKRIGMRLATGATGSFMEASIGALWGEDPRYVRATGQPFKKRLINVAKMTVMARNRKGDLVPAYARFISIPANSFMSNSFRADSEADTRSATIRIPMIFLGRFIGNSFTEFWPDATKWMHRN